MSIDTLLNVTQAHELATELVGAEISRTAFYNWRVFLNIRKRFYTVDEVEAIALFGSYTRKGLSKREALAACKQQSS